MKYETSVWPETAAEWLAKWDADESVFTIEMGGLGPGYEMAIQGLVAEMIRAMLADGFDRNASFDEEVFEADMDAVARKFDSEPWGGFSGAQVGAARSLAFRFLFDGPRGVEKRIREQCKANRFIQVCRRDLRK